MGAELHDSIANDMNQIKRRSLLQNCTRVSIHLEIDGDLLSAKLRMAGRSLTSRASQSTRGSTSWLHESGWFI